MGDTHVKNDILDIVRSVIADYDYVVFIGDYCDDFFTTGEQVIDHLKQVKRLQKEFAGKVTCLVGNHDYIYVNKTRTLQSGYSLETQMLIDAPENRKIKSWLEGLPVIKEIENVWYSHAGISITWDEKETVDSLWKNDSPLWARPGVTSYAPVAQVFGHTPSKTCYEVQPNIWCIDTFSTDKYGSPIGDGSLLEIVDGRGFNVIKL